MKLANVQLYNATTVHNTLSSMFGTKTAEQLDNWYKQRRPASFIGVFFAVLQWNSMQNETSAMFHFVDNNFALISPGKYMEAMVKLHLDVIRDFPSEQLVKQLPSRDSITKLTPISTIGQTGVLEKLPRGAKLFDGSYGNYYASDMSMAFAYKTLARHVTAKFDIDVKFSQLSKDIVDEQTTEFFMSIDTGILLALPINLVVSAFYEASKTNGHVTKQIVRYVAQTYSRILYKVLSNSMSSKKYHLSLTT